MPHIVEVAASLGMQFGPDASALASQSKWLRPTMPRSAADLEFFGILGSRRLCPALCACSFLKLPRSLERKRPDEMPTSFGPMRRVLPLIRHEPRLHCTTRHHPRV